MDEKMKTCATCTLLDLTRKACQRYQMIAQHLESHFDIDLGVFIPDPLLDYSIQMLGEMIRDNDLLMWWLFHDGEDPLYSKNEALGGCEIQTSRELLQYYQENLGREGS